MASAIKASYYKVSIANFAHTDGRRATGVIEYDTGGGYSKDDTGRVL